MSNYSVFAVGYICNPKFRTSNTDGYRIQYC